MNILIILFVTALSCNSNGAYKFFFDDWRFEIPCTVKEFKKKPSIKYHPYQGFKGNTKNGWIAKLQLKDYPIWLGTENVNEHFYDDNSVIGIGFKKNTSQVQVEVLKESLEKTFSTKFENNSENGISYDILVRTKRSFIVIFEKKSSTYICFYNGIEKSNLSEYISGMW